MLRKNDLLEADIIDVNNLGNGIAKDENGFVIFVPNTVTGDRCRIKIIKAAKDYAVARLEALLTPSPYRRDPGCGAASSCGGCVYRYLTREYELKLKENYVRSAMKKCRVEAEVLPVLTTGEETGYRNKVQYPVSPDYRTGYYSRHSHNVVPTTCCLLESPVFRPILDDITAYIAANRLSDVKHVCLRHAKYTGEVMVVLVSARKNLTRLDDFAAGLMKKHPEVVSFHLNLNPEDTNVILGKESKLIAGKKTITDVLCGLTVRISPHSFYQVNHDAAELLYGEAIARAKEVKPASLADLYCGTGTIGLILASAMPDVKLTGVEIVPDAVRDAKENAVRNGIPNADFLCADAAEADLSPFDCVIVDPPRKGCSEALLRNLLNSRPGRIVYVSCGPDTLARDAAFLIAGGYRMGAVQPVDMFPGTGSVECVTVFDSEKRDHNG
ncbi:MAG: 23S rRNA (uracil(1939)-C(5))-methyltransferase RlmD [Lachnospiraceae bacterium]|nr:23S rRNA (uracil(1939)-C(5))-methyltransferase RlmD [Lachnospiraceae bacterium]